MGRDDRFGWDDEEESKHNNQRKRREREALQQAWDATKQASKVVNVTKEYQDDLWNQAVGKWRVFHDLISR